MTIEGARDILAATGTPISAQPVVIDGLFGWFNPGLTRRGVVLCGTLGFEQLAAYRAWRILAEEIAAAGCATLRFDYPGAGDSADPDTLRLADLVGAICRAVAYLRTEAGAEEVVLVGLRFGGTLAALAARDLAARGEDVDRLVLLAPFATGRAYLREMKLQARNTLVWPGGTPLVSKPGTLNVQGFVLNSALIADITAIADTAPAIAPTPDVLIVTGMPFTGATAAATPDTRIRRESFARFNHLVSGEMNFRPLSEVAASAAPLTRRIVEFATEGARIGSMQPRPEPGAGRVAGDGWREETTRFGRGLFGILCRPEADTPRAGSVLFINSGTYVRSGSSRLTTRMARALAAGGVASLRFDLRGTGDSPPWNEDASAFYNLDVLADVTAALDRLSTGDGTPTVVAGLCSGAYLALHTACRDTRITDAVLMNLYCFDWPADVRFESVHGQPLVRGTATYARSLLSLNTWRRIVTGRISVLFILSKLMKAWSRACLKRLSALRDPDHAGPDTVDRIAEARRRGGRFLFVYSADDPGLLNIQRERDLSLAGIERMIGRRIEIIDQCDHNFSTPEAYDRMLNLISGVIADRTPPGRPRAVDPPADPGFPEAAIAPGSA